ncbi:MAG: helix-turn-helix domain-containing protein [Bacteroidetes bacterium]|nr:helix-turn-helix domain-containing protein [Bacteroidota bacterium]
MKKKKLTFDEIPSTLVDIMDRLTAIEGLLKGQKEPKAPQTPKAPRKPKLVPVKEKTAPLSGIMSAEMASKLIGKAKITLYNLAKKGKIPARKEGRNWVFVEAEVLEWLREKKPARKPRVSRKSVKEKPVPAAQPAKRRGRKPKINQEVTVTLPPAVEVVEKKRRGRPKKNVVVAPEPIKRRTGRRPRIVRRPK